MTPFPPHHRLLTRQLRKLGIESGVPDAKQWSEFLGMVATTYHEADLERDTLERSLTISSIEMRELYDDLARSSASELATERDKLRGIMAVQTAVLDASPDGIVVMDQAGNVLLANRRFAEVCRIPAEVMATGDQVAIRRAALAQAVDPDKVMLKVDELQPDQTGVASDELEFRDARVIERYSYPALDATGEVRGRVWAFRDVTSQRRDEARLRDAHAFLDSIFETIPNMVFVKDAEQLRFVRFNRAGEKLLGVPRADILCHTDHDLFPREQADFFVAKDREALAQHDVVTIEEEVIDTPQGPRRLRTRKTPIYGPDGEAKYLLGVSEDITAEREREAELYLAKEHAETASRAKSDFLLNMSHELRTPLNSILGFARVLGRSSNLTPDEVEYLTDITSAGTHMLQLVNDLLDLRALEAHPLELGALELLPPLHEAARMVQPLLAERQQTFETDFAPELPPCVAARRPVVQALINLLTNATKFTPVGGHISLRAFREHNRIVIQVTDDGIGISPEDQAKLFVYFEQLSGKHAHHMQGSGVGLALTRALIEKMGGTIKVTSAVGKGTTFEIKLGVAP